jgi:hypothetical protein
VVKPIRLCWTLIMFGLESDSTSATSPAEVFQSQGWIGKSHFAKCVVLTVIAGVQRASLGIEQASRRKIARCLTSEPDSRTTASRSFFGGDHAAALCFACHCSASRGGGTPADTILLGGCNRNSHHTAFRSFRSAPAASVHVARNLLAGRCFEH